jgi:DNA-binding response OmpR family regulator
VGKTILIIDDEKLICHIIKGRLEANGFKVLIAEAAEAGLKLAEEEKPDLILCDDGRGGWHSSC